MTRRSAFAIAGGVIAALAAAMLAMVVNVGVLSASEAPEGPGTLKAAQPVIKTLKRTKTIHKKVRRPAASSSVAATGTASGASAPSTAPTYQSFDDGDSYEDDDEHEYEEEDEGEEVEHEFDEDDDD